jgi:hypothetical protein
MKDNKADALVTWAVYYNPTDQPGKYVARKFIGETPTHECAVGETLEAVRAAIPPWMVCLARHEDDPANVVEAWI